MSDDSLERTINEPVELAAYDEAWPGRFRAERDRLLGLLPGQLIEVEHFGSTAVPGMPAKPVIDLLAQRHHLDRDAYTDAKTEFILSVIGGR